MFQYIDANKIIQALPQKDNCTHYEAHHCHHSEIKIEFPVCLAEQERFDSCSTRKVRSSTVLYNLPLSHYAEFTGISTNIGIITKSGMLNNNVCGNVHVCVYNSSTESCILPAGMRLGLLYLKQYYDPSEELL